MKYTVTFEEFNVSFWNLLLKKLILTPNLWMVVYFFL